MRHGGRAASALAVLLAAAGLVAWCLSLAFDPLFRARPEFSPGSWLFPPNLVSLVATTLLAFAAAVVLEVAIRRLAGVRSRERRIDSGRAFDEAARTFAPLALLLPCFLLVVPRAPGVPPLVSFLVLDARPWLATLALAGSAGLKLRGLTFSRPPHFVVSGTLLFVALFTLVPGDRLRQPYDERFGTGDEPRYVRIAASLLHDGDADVSNAAENVGRRFSPGRTAAGIASLPGALFRSLREAGRSLLGQPPPGGAASLGGQVVRGRRGGEFYVYLPGFPLLIAAPLALDSLVVPDRLYSVVIFCLLLAVGNAFVLKKLAELVHPRPIETLGLAVVLALTPPLAAYSFQVYPEVAAATALSVSMIVVLRETGSLTRWELAAFATGTALLPWLHTKYYPLLGAMLAGFAVRHRRLPKLRLGVTLGVPALAVLLQSLYMFEIAGSFLPDALWVLNGYPRGTHVFNAETRSGLYHLFLGRSEGLLVYAPHTALAAAGLVALRRRNRAAFRLSLLVLVPYVWVAASHDQGGAGGWSPPCRYFVPVMPVFALALASWLGERRSPARLVSLSVLAAASFWIGVGMLQERNFLYDRAAFLSSGAIDPSPLLGSTDPAEPWGRKLAYPAFLATMLLLLRWAERERVKARSVVASILLLVFVAGNASLLWSRPSQWAPSRQATQPRILRPGRSETVLFRDCAEPVLRFEGGDQPTPLRASGSGFERELVLSSSSTTEMAAVGAPFREWTGSGRVDWLLLRLRSATGGARVRVEPVCRKEKGDGNES